MLSNACLVISSGFKEKNLCERAKAAADGDSHADSWMNRSITFNARPPPHPPPPCQDSSAPIEAIMGRSTVKVFKCDAKKGEPQAEKKK